MISRFVLPYTLKVPAKTILDIGPGKTCEATEFWLENNKLVTSIDIEDYRKINHPNHTFLHGNFLTIQLDKKFDMIYASHVLEHIQDTGVFLRKVRKLLSPSGYFFIIVPIFKHNIVGGHVHVWNMGLLMYNLILSGFDVRNGKFTKQGYSIVGVVQAEKRKLPQLVYDRGDIETLKQFFPDDEMFQHGFNGDLTEWNWYK